MITIPAMRLTQFGVVFYQAALPVADIRKLVRFEVLSFGERAGKKRRRKKSKSGVNWEELERKISGSEKAYQRPILKKKIEELVDKQDRKFMKQARDFFLKYFKQVAQVFPKAWNGRKYCLKRAPALRAFMRVAPEVIRVCRDRRLDPMSGRALAQVLAPWGERIGDRRFEDGQWREERREWGPRIVDHLARDLEENLK